MILTLPTLQIIILACTINTGVDTKCLGRTLDCNSKLHGFAMLDKVEKKIVKYCIEKVKNE